MRHYLLIDLGTGSTRAAIVGSDGNIVAMHSFFNRYFRDEAYPDAQYFLPQEWEAEIFRCCRQVHAEHPEITISAVSARASFCWTRMAMPSTGCPTSTIAVGSSCPPSATSHGSTSAPANG